MNEPFFNFNEKLSSKLNLDEEFLTGDVEDEYDALNDQTFGLAADDGDWEEGHDKFTELVGRKESPDTSSTSHLSSMFDTSLLDGDDSHQEIISKSISQLGLEDDLDDPAIMTIGRMQSSWPKDSSFRLSPPPPAIIDPELCGSPKAYSIWSTNHSSSTPLRDSGVGSLFHSLSHPSNHIESNKQSTNPEKSFSSSIGSRAWTLEEVEHNFRSQSKLSSDWPPLDGNHLVESLKSAISNNNFHHNETNRNSSENTVTCPGVRTLDDLEKDILLKRQPSLEDKNSVKIDTSPVAKPAVNNKVWQAIMRPRLPPAPLRMPPNIQNMPPRFPFPVGPMMSRLGQNPHRNFMPGPGMMPTPNLMMHPNKAVGLPFPGGKPIDNRFRNWRYPIPRPMFYPTSVLDPQTMNLAFGHQQQRRLPYYLLPGGVPGDPMFQDGRNNMDYRKRDLCTDDDEYAGLMTHKEKEWLLRIQLMLIQTDNPYVEDFYYSTFLMRKCVQEALKNSDKKSPKLILPERSTRGTKAYVPAQFEGSLGKLQAVSVNFPRKVLDITVSRTLEDEEGRVVTNQSLMKYRRLLVDIEKLYDHLLEIDEEEKRILALPEQAHLPHKEMIEKLTDKLLMGLGCVHAPFDDTFQNIMTICKGRNLGIRSFQIFSREQQLCFLIAFFRCFTTLLRKDVKDMIFLKNVDVFTTFIQKLTLPELLLLAKSLENLPRTDNTSTPSVREKSHFIASFKNKFGSTIVCCILEHAESLQNGSEIQNSWAEIVLHVADILCSIPETSIVPPLEPYSHLLAHFKRFEIDRDKLEVLKPKLNIFQLEISNEKVNVSHS